MFSSSLTVCHNDVMITNEIVERACSEVGAFTDDQGVKRGFDVDLCHALAAAVLGDGSKIQVSPLGLRDAFASRGLFAC